MFNVVPLAGVVGEVDAAILRIDSARAEQRARSLEAPPLGPRRAAEPLRLAEGG